MYWELSPIVRITWNLLTRIDAFQASNNLIYSWLFLLHDWNAKLDYNLYKDYKCLPWRKWIQVTHHGIQWSFNEVSMDIKYRSDSGRWKLNFQLAELHLSTSSLLHMHYNFSIFKNPFLFNWSSGSGLNLLTIFVPKTGSDMRILYHTVFRTEKMKPYSIVHIILNRYIIWFISNSTANFRISFYDKYRTWGWNIVESIGKSSD